MIKSLFVKSQISQFATLKNCYKKLLKWDRGSCSEHTWYHGIVVTLFIGLLGVDDPLSTISVLIETRPAATLLSRQRYDGCYCVWIGYFFQRYFFFTFLVELFMMSSPTVPHMYNTKTVNISKMKEDIPKRKTPYSFLILEKSFK